jgi:hypothetical protein
VINTANTVVATVSAGTSPVTIGNFIGGSPAAAAVSFPMPTLSELGDDHLGNFAGVADVADSPQPPHRMTLFWSDFANA